MKQYYQEITEFKRTENGSEWEAADSSVEAIIVKTNKAFAVNVQEKNKHRKQKSTTQKSSVNSSGKKKRESSTSKISAAMDDLKKFSKSLVKELKRDYQIMLEEMKKDLGNLAAGDSNLKTTKSKGKRILSSDYGQEQKRIRGEPLHKQKMNPTSSRNFITPAGQFASNTRVNYAKERLMMTGNLSYPHQNTSSGMGSSRFPLIPIHQRLGNTFRNPNQSCVGNSSGGGPMLFPDRSFPDNYFRAINFYDNYEMNEACRLREYGRNDSCSQGTLL